MRDRTRKCSKKVLIGNCAMVIAMQVSAKGDYGK